MLMPKSSKWHLLFRFFISNFTSICCLSSVYCTSQPSCDQCDFWLLLWCKWYCCSNGILCSVELLTFGTVCWSQLQGSSSLRKMPRTRRYVVRKGMVWEVTSYQSAQCEMPEQWRSFLAVLHCIIMITAQFM
jgi:hypothetical protein